MPRRIDGKVSKGTSISKAEDLVKSRHSSEPRIESGAGSGVRGIYDYLKELDSGFRQTN